MSFTKKALAHFNLKRKTRDCPTCGPPFRQHISLYQREYHDEPQLGIQCKGGCTLINEEYHALVNELYAAAGATRYIREEDAPEKENTERLIWVWRRGKIGERDAYIATITTKFGQKHSYQAVLYWNTENWRWAVYDATGKPMMDKMQKSDKLHAHRVNTEIMRFIRKDIKKAEKAP